MNRSEAGELYSLGVIEGCRFDRWISPIVAIVFQEINNKGDQKR